MSLIVAERLVWYMKNHTIKNEIVKIKEGTDLKSVPSLSIVNYTIYFLFL